VASIGNDPGGRKRILFVAGDKRRKTIRLGKVSKRQAETVRGHVENLVAADLTGQAPPDETSRWVAALPDLLRKRLVAVGLVAPAPDPEAAPEGPTLGEFLEAYIEGRADVVRNTRLKYEAAQADLLAYFTANRPLDDIGPADAEDFAVWLRTKRQPPLSEGTARRRVGIAKQFFTAAVKRRLLRDSPFAEVKAGEFSAPRFHFVDAETARAVMDALPDPAWRLAFALARWGGLRVPSEVTALRWCDVSWERSRFTVHARKTAKHAGKATRTVPIFPELGGPFHEAFEAAEDGAVFCCHQYPERFAGQMYRKVVLRALAGAGVEPWEKLFVNLRATRTTELVEQFPAFVAAAWLGHSPKVALKHYLRVTEDHFARASGAAQNPAQYLPVSGLPEQEGGSGDVGEIQDLPPDTATYRSAHINMVGRAGVEPATPAFSVRCSTT